MDMNLIYAMLIALIPVVLAIIFTKIYNIVHGIISFLFFGAILMLCLHIFGDKMPVTMTYFEVFGGFYTGLSGFLCNPSNGLVTFVAYGLLGIFGLGDVVVNNPQVAFYFYLAIIGLIFLISQIISSRIFRRRASRRRELKRQAKRY